MSAEYINKAERKLDASRDAFSRMLQNADTQMKLESAWSDFLSNSDAFFEVLKHGTKGTSHQQHVDQVLNERKEDQLMHFLLQSRNADHHRKEEPLQRLVQLHFSPTCYDSRTAEREMAEAKETRATLPSFPATKFKVKPVTNRGVDYPIPSYHMGRRIDLRTPLELGHLALLYKDQIFKKFILAVNLAG